MADRKPENMPTTGNVSEGVPNSQNETMHVYGSGDSFGTDGTIPKGAEVMRKRAEPGEKADASYTETGDNSPAE